ncbi:AI-2E family transporter [Lichenicola cladoniae]|uniref:AI-2E family transporter n=1 Tax=Lichenicola cladoniae TaxID=1484109 RepID=A0A6M8HRA4_9PROT|nr:AI-2E family transporter [Lichenicola cladoniae]NPD68780.1 AI-2E family transporter [Acetobacteraceae bacterium]QKE90797.1 AI-2E family transporter [Lichenicola cladoniae]
MSFASSRPTADLPRARVPAADTPPAEKLTGIVAGVVIVAALYLGREVLIPITLSVLLSFVLAPLVLLLQRLWVPKIPAVLLSVITALGVLLVLGGIIGTQIASLSSDLPRYQSTIEHKVASVRSFTSGHLREITNKIGKETSGGGPQATAPTAPDGQKPMPVVVQQPSPTPIHLLQQVLSPIVSPLETIGIVFVVAIFILMQREDLRDRMIRLFGSDDLLRTTAALDDAGSRLGRYFLTQLGINALFGVIIGVGLMLIGVPNPILWGVLGTLLRFVPYVGSAIAAILPIALAAAVDPGWSMVAWAAALFVVTEGAMGQVVEPLVYGHATGLSPVAVIVVAIFWSWIWGPIGLILSTPLTLCLVVMGRHIERLEFLDILLGDRPALTPIESFYQRMLANDDDEMLRQAGTSLKQRSLSSYYDDIVLKGLMLAAADMQRGALLPERAIQINQAVQELVNDLDGHDDLDPSPGATEQPLAGKRREDREVPVTPPPLDTAPARTLLPSHWQGHSPILCVAGRGPLDLAASTMLAQLLKKHAIGARVASHNDVSRETIDTFDVSGIAMICVSYLDLSGNPVRIRGLLRRLRQRIPDVPIMMGLWPASTEGDPRSGAPDDHATDDELRSQIGADFYAGSLAEAVSECVRFAHMEAEASAV